MSKLIDLKGRKFGSWYVLEYAGKSMWTCRCECGKIKKVSSTYLLNGKSKSCIECSRIKTRSKLIGKIYNNWKLISFLGESVYICLCLKCKAKYPVSIGNITSGKSKQCYKCSSATITHGMSKSRLYSIWQRFPRKKDKVCDKWLDSFNEFIVFAYGTGYTNEKHLIRIDKSGIFEPKNCKWSFSSEPSMRGLANINGITRTQTEWAKHLGISRQAFHIRLAKSSDPKVLLASKNEFLKKSASKYRRKYGMTLHELSIKHQVSITKVMKMIRERKI